MDIKLDLIRRNNFEANDQCDWFSFSLLLYTSVRASLKHPTTILAFLTNIDPHLRNILLLIIIIIVCAYMQLDLI